MTHISEETLAAVREGLDAVKILIEESKGVQGLHLNGDLAPWEDLRTGGKYEEWLFPFDKALALLPTPAPVPMDAVVTSFDYDTAIAHGNIRYTEGFAAGREAAVRARPAVTIVKMDVRTTVNDVGDAIKIILDSYQEAIRAIPNPKEGKSS